nr:hypothetical protein GCM10017611_46220 [Rhodococcus wratislaviensis]
MEHRVTYTIGSITVFNALSDVPGVSAAHFPSVRTLSCGGARISPSTRLAPSRRTETIGGSGVDRTARRHGQEHRGHGNPGRSLASPRSADHSVHDLSRRLGSPVVAFLSPPVVRNARVGPT